MKSIFLLLLSMISFGVKAQETAEPFRWLWISANYATPVITSSSYYNGGTLELKAGGRITYSNITLVGGVSNTVSQDPERFSLFLGPGYMFKDRWIFLSMHTGLNYPFYKNSPEVEQALGMHNAIDIGLRVVPKFTIGVGMNQLISNDIPAYAFRVFLQLSSQ